MSLKILVVDDAPAVRLVLRSALQRVGVDPHTIFEASNPGEAWVAFRRIRPEIVFMDLSLDGPSDLRGAAVAPGPAGAQAPRTVEAGEGLARRMLYADPALKLVVCTGHPPDSPAIREVIKFGAYCVFIKPVRMESVRRLFQLLSADGISNSPHPPPVEDPRGPAGELRG